MLRTSMIFLTVFSFCVVLTAGCGSTVESGVATGPDEPEPVLTPEEEETEMQSIQEANEANN